MNRVAGASPVTARVTAMFTQSHGKEISTLPTGYRGELRLPSRKDPLARHSLILD